MLGIHATQPEVSTTMSIGDLPGYKITEVDKKLMEVYTKTISIKTTGQIWTEIFRMTLPCSHDGKN
jgi:hypothetical protein